MTIIYVKNGIGMNTFVGEIHKYIDIKSIDNLCIFDIGSRDGNDARYLHNCFALNAKHAKHANTYAFEAHPQEYEIHKDINRDINWINLAIYEYDGQIVFFPKTINSGIHSIRDRGSEFGQGEIIIPCKKVSTILHEFQINVPQIVKIDVEGCSLEVLRSFEDRINDVMIFHIESEEEEYFKDQYLQSQVFAYLEAHGFFMTMYSTTDGSNQHDSVWVNPSAIRRECLQLKSF